MNPATLAKIRRWVVENKVEVVTAAPENNKDVVDETVAAVAEQPKEEVVSKSKEEVKTEEPKSSEPVIYSVKSETILGDCVEALKRFPDNTFTAVVTDPPYGLSAQPNMREVLEHWLRGDDYKHSSNGFMGKSWDSFVPGPKIWAEIMRVLKPGGHILSFSGTRTYDLMVTAMRLAGSEIRDKIDYYCEQQETLSWVYGSGFPKSLNIGKALEKSARGCPQGSTKGDPQKSGKGGIPNRNVLMMGGNNGGAVTGLTDDYENFVPKTDDGKLWAGMGTALKPAHEPIASFAKGESNPLNPDVPFKYEAKASGKERNLGCSDLFWLIDADGKTLAIPKEDYDKMEAENEARKEEAGFDKHKITQGNIWATVKPLDLMRYLVRMVKMPGENLILDPFMGSGTTPMACVLEGCGFVGIDMDEVAMRIAQHRIEYAKTHKDDFKE